MTFNENWYSDAQITELVRAVKTVKGLPGRFVEIGCWEGKSTAAIANECFPEQLEAVDTWQGNIDEKPDHETVKLAAERDVFQVFSGNMKALTKGNVVPHRQDCFEYLGALNGPVRFCHIDACHDYASVKKTIALLLPRLVPGGVLCGDDFRSAHVGRADLNGGVQRAVLELCPFSSNRDNFWSYRHSAFNRLFYRVQPLRVLAGRLRIALAKLFN